jgi:hypothetical protein
MPKLSSSLVKTWLFLISSTDPELARSKFFAYRALKQCFGSVDLALLYIEQLSDKQIEVVVI